LEHAGEVEHIDLTKNNKSHGVWPVADPKLFTVGEEVWATFNTGYVASGQNSVYIQRIFPSLGVPQECLLADRNAIEKNWAFFHDGHRLRALYSLNPLQILNAEPFLPGSRTVAFSRQAPASPGSGFPLTIGTQLAFTKDRSIMIAHEKISFRGRRAYFGRALELDLRYGQERIVRTARTALVHSIASLVPRLDRPNPNLLSATYFSGMCVLGGQVLVSYGINDVRAGFARLEEELIW